MVWYSELARRILLRPTPNPSGGQAARLAKSSTALHFLIPPSTIGLQFGRFRRWRAGIEVDWRAHPGSEFGTCFHSNRSSRLGPAHQVMKSGSCGLVQRVGTADSATPHPDPSGGQAPALHFLIPPSAIGLQFGRFRRCRAGIEVDWGAHLGSESGTCFHSNRSSRLGPAHQVMKSGSCGLVQRVGTADSATPHPDPSGGQAPRLAKSSTALHFLIPSSAIGLQFGRFRRCRAGIEVDWRAHPGSESGTCFHSNRSSRLGPAHQVMKSGSCGLVQRVGTADSATPHPDPSGGQAPRLAKSSTALHFLIPSSAIGLQFGRFRRCRAGIEVDWRAHPGSEFGTCFHSNRSCRLPPAHQGMKMGARRWKSLGVVGAAPPPPLDSRLRGNDEWGVAGALESRLSAFSYQSPMPAGAGTPRYENWVHWLEGEF